MFWCVCGVDNLRWPQGRRQRLQRHQPHAQTQAPAHIQGGPQARDPVGRGDTNGARGRERDGRCRRLLRFRARRQARQQPRVRRHQHPPAPPRPRVPRQAAHDQDGQRCGGHHGMAAARIRTQHSTQLAPSTIRFFRRHYYERTAISASHSFCAYFQLLVHDNAYLDLN